MKNILKYKVFLFVIMLIFTACSTTKYVQEGQYLLSKAKVKIDDKRVTKSEAESFLKQKPNGSALGIKAFYLRIYNLSGRDTTKGINRFIRKIGEPPVIYDSIKTRRTVVQLGRFMEAKGFYNSKIKVEKKYKKRKVKVTYSITANEPKVIDSVFLHKNELPEKVIGKRNIAIELADSSDIRKILFSEQKKATISSNDLLDVDKLKAERERLEKLYKSKGYYFFDKDNVHFYIDTATNKNRTKIYYGIRTEDASKLRKYKVREVKVFLDVEARDKETLDSLNYGGLKIFYKSKLPYNPEVLAKSIVLKEGQVYNPTEVEETKDRLALLQQFRYSNVSFRDFPNTDSIGQIDCFVQLKSRKRQSYRVEGTVTYNSGDWGWGTSLNYKHQNLFKGAELFSAQLSYGRERVRGFKTDERLIVKEFGGAISLSTPKFFLPFFKMKRWRAKYPRTTFSVLHNYVNRPEYRRTVTDLVFSYRWNSSRSFIHVFAPIDLGVLRVNADKDFLKNLNNYYRQTSYVDHIIPAARYSLFFNNKGNTDKTTYQRFRINVETSGYLLNKLDKLVHRNAKETDAKGNDYYSYFGIRYAQYLRSDVEFTYNQFVNPKHAIIYHTFIGVGHPYGNSKVMPFEKMYFAGGANSMRAWQPRSLGPGASKKYNPNERFSYGEMKLEGNIEYRFTIRKQLEGAAFVDMGNVWNLSEISDNDLDSRFFWSDFYKQIAVGSGVGIRYNWSGIILRLDTAIKIRDPYLKNNRFTIDNFKDVSFNFGIGYPF